MDPYEAVTTVMVVGMLLGIPLLGITVRISIRPMVDAWVRLREAQARPVNEVEGLKLRVAALEAILEAKGMLPGALDPVALGTPVDLLPPRVKRS